MYEAGCPNVNARAVCGSADSNSVLAICRLWHCCDGVSGLAESWADWGDEVGETKTSSGSIVRGIAIRDGIKRSPITLRLWWWPGRRAGWLTGWLVDWLAGWLSAWRLISWSDVVRLRWKFSFFVSDCGTWGRATNGLIGWLMDWLWACLRGVENGICLDDIARRWVGVDMLIDWLNGGFLVGVNGTALPVMMSCGIKQSSVLHSYLTSN